MGEDFLHYVWKFGLFNSSELTTVQGEILKIKKTGISNQDAGPDFFNAQIYIDQTLWAGNVEIHLKSSDWYRHNHQNDFAYDKIILHVVWEDDQAVLRSNGTHISTLVLKGRVRRKLLESYFFLRNRKSWIACDSQIQNLEPYIIWKQLERVLVDRLLAKCQRIETYLKLNKNDWEDTNYKLLFKAFGFKVNAIPFELLSNALPLQIIRKHRHNLTQLEALIFGTAGLLSLNCTDEYFQRLHQEFEFLKSKYGLKPMKKHLWKYSRMRPANFPDIRMAQLAQLLHQQKRIFQFILNASSVEDLCRVLELKASSYWVNHFRFGQQSKIESDKSLGKGSIHNIIINVFIPLIFERGLKYQDEELKKKAITFLESLPSESNSIVRSWGDLGIKARSAFDSQAMIQQKKMHCDLKKCLNCMLGSSILKQEK